LLDDCVCFVKARKREHISDNMQHKDRARARRCHVLFCPSWTSRLSGCLRRAASRAATRVVY